MKGQYPGTHGEIFVIGCKLKFSFFLQQSATQELKNPGTQQKSTKFRSGIPNSPEKFVSNHLTCGPGAVRRKRQAFWRLGRNMPNKTMLFLTRLITRLCSYHILPVSHPPVWTVCAENVKISYCLQWKISTDQFSQNFRLQVCRPFKKDIRSRWNNLPNFCHILKCSLHWSIDHKHHKKRS